MKSELGIYQDVLENTDVLDIPKILIVEDDEFCAMLIAEFLDETNYNLSFAGDGEKALKLCESNNYNLVLLDIQLPKVDGLQVAKHLKQIKPELPLIAITASAINYSIIKSFGIDMIIEKPIPFDKLLSSIKQYC